MTKPTDPLEHATLLAADTLGELVAFWGFKPSMGKIWTVLYLSDRPLTADELARRCQLSAGSVSMALGDLLQWGIGARASVIGQRKRHYQAETDVWAIVRRIFRERELRLVQQALERFEQAQELLEQAPDSPRVQHARRRLERLTHLARIGRSLVEKLADVGQVSLTPIRGALSRALGVDQ